VKVNPARLEIPVTFSVEPSIVAPLLFKNVAVAPANVEVPETASEPRLPKPEAVTLVEETLVIDSAVPVAEVNVVDASDETPDTVSPPPICSLPLTTMNEAEAPANVEVPVMVVVAAVMPEVTDS
jgi:hypothetical protein